MSIPAGGWVIVAWAPDEYGAVALDWALADAERRDRGVVVVNASKGDALVDDRYAFDDQLAELERRLADSGRPHEIRQSIDPDVGGAVLDAAEQLDARLIVVGLRRRTPVGKLLMGSVAQRILLAAACPVLSVKPGSVPD
ncbi:MAG: universal stress protein [Nocardioides sp.]|uniref:universal stress protein n=1 Tax=Nocardioides sp. TaxID=35761 RepID=UPI003D6C16EC